MIGSLATPDTTLAIMNASQQSEEIQKNAKTLEEFDKTAKEFEAMFVAEMMKPMFDGFLIEEYGALIADSGAIGMKDTIKLQLIKLQETANAAQ